MAHRTATDQIYNRTIHSPPAILLKIKCLVINKSRRVVWNRHCFKILTNFKFQRFCRFLCVQHSMEILRFVLCLPKVVIKLKSNWKAWFSVAHKHKHKHMCKANENWVDIGRSISTRKTSKFILLVLMLNYLVALTSENWVDMSTSISTKSWTNHKSLWPRPRANSPSCKHMRSNMADEASAILFIIGLRRAGIENWAKFAILRVRMSLCLFLR